jgi:signal-transduction protein with cAMP-binding, CBS, and nucleotidyltransferase domain
MFILRRGRVEVLAKDGRVLVTLEQGQFFGEIGLFAVRARACV